MQDGGYSELDKIVGDLPNRKEILTNQKIFANTEKMYDDLYAYKFVIENYVR